MDLSAQRVLVTGGTSGIGLALAVQLVAKGARVAVCGRSAERIEALKASHPEIASFRFDLSEVDKLPSLVADLLRSFGAPTVLINNAGVQFNNLLTDLDADARVAAIRKEIAVNLTSPLALTALLLDALRQTPGSVVVNITSILAWTPKRSAPVYCATKAGLRSFTNGIRYQLADDSGPRMLEVVPPLVDTAMTAGRGSGKISPAEAAEQIIAALESDADRVYIGKAKILSVLWRLSPGLVAKIVQNG